MLGLEVRCQEAVYYFKGLEYHHLSLRSEPTQGQHGTLMVAQSRELGTVCPEFVFKLKMLLLSN